MRAATKGEAAAKAEADVRKDEKGHCARFPGEKRLKEKTKMRRTMEGVDQYVPVDGDDGGNVVDVGSVFGEAALPRKDFTLDNCAEKLGEFAREGVAGNILE